MVYGDFPLKINFEKFGAFETCKYPFKKKKISQKALLNIDTNEKIPYTRKFILLPN